MKKPILDEKKLPVVMELIDRVAVIFDEEDYENDDVIKEEIAKLEDKLIELTGKNIEQCQPFEKYWAYTDLETVAMNILMPAPQKENLSDEQLREIFDDIVNVHQNEAETDYLLEVLRVETGLEDITDYIYYPDIVGLSKDASEEEIFQKILSDRCEELISNTVLEEYEEVNEMTGEMQDLIDKYWEEDQHDKIVEMILAVPEEKRDIHMKGQLVVAYNNLGKYNDAIALSMELEEESVDIPAWYYRIGFAYVSKADYFTAAKYLEKGIALANKQGKIVNAKNCQELYEECEPYMQRAKKKPTIPPVIMNSIGLEDYKKAIFVNGMTETELLAEIKQYEEIAAGGKIQATIHLKYAPINADWIYIDYEYASEFEGWNFWHFQNFLLWLTDGKNDSFCLAYKDLNNTEDLLYAYFNKQDKTGASVVGWFKGAQYYYEVPGFYLSWLTEEGTAVLSENILYTKRGMDISVLEHMEDWSWKMVEIIVSD
ncbi:MAG: hypothetical protein IKK33_15590 [Lachnospiraceae bacterium]|nr:hypothetical protein [Lachnospiraceae bacterium]